MTKHELTLSPTEEHWRQLESLGRLWIAQSRTLLDPDRRQTEKTIAELYNWLQLEPPAIVWCESPWQLAVMPCICSGLLGDKQWPARADGASQPWLSLWQKLNAEADCTFQRLKSGHSQDFFEPIKDPDSGNLKRRDKDFFRALRRGHFFVDFSPQLTLGHEDFILQLSSGCHLNLSTKSFAAIKRVCLDPFTREGGSLIRRQIHAELNRDISWQRLVDQMQPHMTLTTKTEMILSWPGHSSDWTPAPTWQEAPTVLQAALSNVWWGAWTSNWLPVYEFLFSAFDLPSADEATRHELNLWLALARQATAYVFFKRICFVCLRPRFISADDLGRAHHEERAAVTFKDGYKLFSWHGTTVPERVITCPEEITVKSIENTANAEVRRVMIERFGGGRYICQSGARKIQEDQFGVLYSKSIPGDEPLVMVKVINKTAEADGSYKDYFLRVPPTITKARDAVAWTFSMREDEYSPDRES